MTLLKMTKLPFLTSIFPLPPPGGGPVLRGWPPLPAPKGMLRPGLLLPVRTAQCPSDAHSGHRPRAESVLHQPLVLLVLPAGDRPGPALCLFPVEETPPAVRLGFPGSPLAIGGRFGRVVLRAAAVQPVQLVPHPRTAAVHRGHVEAGFVPAGV
uniref:(northern house mosquito) hypothetical protein n=2 Tax=Culex pipiens TaxID=7175 RepID=A0A8D8F0L1_CULPI